MPAINDCATANKPFRVYSSMGKAIVVP